MLLVCVTRVRLTPITSIMNLMLQTIGAEKTSLFTPVQKLQVAESMNFLHPMSKHVYEYLIPFF